MFHYEITYLIHSLIRTHKMVHLIEGMLDRGGSEEKIIDGLIRQFKNFLKKEDNELFETNRLKYLTYLDNFKSHIGDIPEISERKTTDINSDLLTLYELPKKRNNLFAILLVFFFLSTHKKSKGKIIFKVIHLYFLIIVYRNRLSREMRHSIDHLDTQSLSPIETHQRKFWQWVTKRYPILWEKYLFSALFLTLIIGGVFGISHLDVSLLRADAMSAVSHAPAFSKVAMDSLFLGRVTDGIYGNIQSIGLQNILMIALIAILFQSIRTGFTNLLVNSLFVKFFQFIGGTLRAIGRSIAFLYNYIIYILATRYLFRFVEVLLRHSILPTTAILVIFLLGYIGLYAGVISLYVALGIAISPWVLPMWQILFGIFLIVAVLIYANLSVDINNFRNFLICIESILAGKTEGKKGDWKDKTEPVTA